MADSLLVFVPHQQAHGACSILKEVTILSPDGIKARAVQNVMKLIANSPGAAKVALAKMAREAGGLPCSMPMPPMLIVIIAAGQNFWNNIDAKMSAESSTLQWEPGSCWLALARDTCKLSKASASAPDHEAGETYGLCCQNGIAVSFLLFDDSHGAMRLLMWHPCQKDVASCFLQLLDRIDATLT